MKKDSSAASKTELPPRFRQFDQQYPAVMRAYEALGAAAQEAGPLDPKTRELVKLGIAIGARSEGATQSHTVARWRRVPRRTKYVTLCSSSRQLSAFRL